MQNALPSYTTSYDTTVARESWSLSSISIASSAGSSSPNRHYLHSRAASPTPTPMAAILVPTQL